MPPERYSSNPTKLFQSVDTIFDHDAVRIGALAFEHTHGLPLVFAPSLQKLHRPLRVPPLVISGPGDSTNSPGQEYVGHLGEFLAYTSIPKGLHCHRFDWGKGREGIWRHLHWRSLPWTCNSVKVDIKFHVECKLHFPSAQLMLRQMHLTNVPESNEAKYRVSWLRLYVEQAWTRAMKPALNSSFCAVTSDSKWPHDKKRAIFGVWFYHDIHAVFVEPAQWNILGCEVTTR